MCPQNALIQDSSIARALINYETYFPSFLSHTFVLYIYLNHEIKEGCKGMKRKSNYLRSEEEMIFIFIVHLLMRQYSFLCLHLLSD